MERLRQYALLLCAVLILGTALGGCGERNSISDYRDFPFSAVVSWTVGEMSVKARIDVSSDGTVCAEMMEPCELAGIVLISQGKERKILCGDIELEAGGMDPFFDTVHLLLPVGTRRVVCTTEWEGVRVTYAEIEGEKKVELYLEPESGAPIGIRCGETVLTVHSFEFRLQKGEEIP